MKKLSLLALFLSVIPVIASGTTVTIGPTENVAVFWIDQSQPNTNFPSIFQKWGQVFTVPTGETFLDTASFYIRGSSSPDAATFFQVKLSKWDSTLLQPLSSPIYESPAVLISSLDSSSPNSEWGTPPSIFFTSLLVTPGDSYILK